MLAWLVNNNHLSKIELADPCFTMLTIHEVLYPRGEPISLDGFTGKILRNVELQTASTSSTLLSTFTEVQEIGEENGNITLDNAKQELHKFAQSKKIKIKYEYKKTVHI